MQYLFPEASRNSWSPPPSLKDHPPTFDYFLPSMRNMPPPLIFVQSLILVPILVLRSLFVTSPMTLPMVLDHTMMNHVKIQLRVFWGIADIDIVVPVGQTAHTALKV
jgi:hypothetical protein